MASSNQYSRGLKFILASLAVLFFLAISVESRGVGFSAILLAENTGRVTSNNRNLVGQALVYLNLQGRNAYGLNILVVTNADPVDITKVVLYNTQTKESYGEPFTFSNGYYLYDARVNYSVGSDINLHQVSIGIYTQAIGTTRPAIAGPIENNRFNFLTYLQAKEEVTAPTGQGSPKHDGFAAARVYTNDSINFFVTVVVNHDLDITNRNKITGIHLHGPAASNTNGPIIVNLQVTGDQSGKVFKAQINGTVYYWMSNHLTYINVHTTNNPDGALRGQLIPTTTPRPQIPVFPNGSTIKRRQTTTTFLPDGSNIVGDLKLALNSGGAQQNNKSLDLVDPLIAYFNPNQGNFNNTFRFPLPTTQVNRHNTRHALLVFASAAEVADNLKYNLKLANAETLVYDQLYSVPGRGNRTFETISFDYEPSTNFVQYLGPGGLFVNIYGTGLTDSLYVDRFYIIYYIASAYSNNIIKEVFFNGSPAQKDETRR